MRDLWQTDGVNYHKYCGRSIPAYSCTREQGEYGGSRCQGVIGTGVDRAIGELLLGAVTPMALEVALSVQEELQRRFDESDKIRRQQIDRAQYEADLAQRRYMQVDPDNRLVAESLEVEWNEKLLALEKAKDEYNRLCERARLAMDEQNRPKAEDLSEDQQGRNKEVQYEG